MKSVTVIIPLAFITQAHAKELATDKMVATLANRAFKARSVDSADLESTALVKATGKDFSQFFVPKPKPHESHLKTPEDIEAQIRKNHEEVEQLIKASREETAGGSSIQETAVEIQRLMTETEWLKATLQKSLTKRREKGMSSILGKGNKTEADWLKSDFWKERMKEMQRHMDKAWQDVQSVVRKARPLALPAKPHNSGEKERDAPQRTYPDTKTTTVDPFADPFDPFSPSPAPSSSSANFPNPSFAHNFAPAGFAPATPPPSASLAASLPPAPPPPPSYDDFFSSATIPPTPAPAPALPHFTPASNAFPTQHPPPNAVSQSIPTPTTKLFTAPFLNIISNPTAALVISLFAGSVLAFSMLHFSCGKQPLLASYR